VDPRSGRHFGSFPQAFGHLALVNAVVHVIRADQELARSEPLVAAPAAGFVVPDEED
jgi:hypothetical protein